MYQSYNSFGDIGGMPSGYTAIEEYLNELAGKMIGNENF
jgi:hypothetical protein